MTFDTDSGRRTGPGTDPETDDRLVADGGRDDDGRDDDGRDDAFGDGSPTDESPRDDGPTEDAPPEDAPTDGGPSDGSETDGDAGADADEDVMTDEEAEELLQEIERKRSLSTYAAVFVSVVGITFSLYQMWLAARGFTFSVDLPVVGDVGFGQLQLLQVNAVHVAFALVLAFVLFPPTSGTGAVAGRVGRVVPAAEARLGASNPVTRGLAGVRRGVRWVTVDADRNRVTPIDVVLVVLSVATAEYMVTEWTEIQRLRVFGLEAGQSVAEYLGPFGFLAEAVSAVGIPLADISYPFLLGALGVLLVLEATRRALGIYLTLIVASFIVYARYGFLITPETPVIGVLSITEGSWPNIIQNLWYNTENGVFGIPVAVSVQFIYIFILFGAFLEMSGAGQWFIDLAYAATGTRRGGPAKASILASGFMGMISGSSIANTVTTGAFTIPLMKKSGYRPEFAGAVESSASSGGQILPPVMGAAAFLMIEFIGVPFSDIIIAATIPAIVFFFGVWVMVHLEAVRVDIGGLDESEVVDLRTHLLSGWFYLLPIGLLLFYLLVERLTVARSAWFTLVAIMALIAFVSAYNRRTRIPLVGAIVALTVVQFAAYLTAGVGVLAAVGGGGGEAMSVGEAVFAAGGDLGTIITAVSLAFLVVRPRIESPLLDLDGAVDDASVRIAAALRRPSLADLNIFRYGTFVTKSMDSGARTATEVVVAVAAAGIIPGVVSATGLGPNLTALIRTTAGESLVLLLVFTAIASIILGMGMPTTVTYIILVSLLGPAIAQSSDIPLLAAHLFILYFGVIADITPPVAVAAYAASGIAKSDPFQTGVQAFSLSLNKAIVPFAFALTPGILLLRGSGESARILTMADVTDVAYFLPEVLIPIIGVFVGVVALGVTVIGHFYAPAGRSDRLLFAVSALLLMAPMLLLNAVTDVLGVFGVLTNLGEPLVLDVGMRAVGAVLFAVLALRNRRGTGEQAEPSAAPATN